MRVRIRFRYRSDTGEVEMFQVDDLQEGLPNPDHDARHDAAAIDVARVVEAHPMVTEVVGDRPEPARETASEPGQPELAGRPEDRRLRD